MRTIALLLELLMSASSAFAESECKLSLGCEDVVSMQIIEGIFSVDSAEANTEQERVRYMGCISLEQGAKERRRHFFAQCEGRNKQVWGGDILLKTIDKSIISTEGQRLCIMADTEEKIRSMLNAICPEKVPDGFISSIAD